MIHSSKMIIMNKKKLRSTINGSMLASAFCFFVVACNNNKSEYGSYDTGSSASAHMPADPRFVNVPVDTNALTKTPPMIDGSVNKPIMAEEQPVTPVSKPIVKKRVKASVSAPAISRTSQPEMSTRSVNESAAVNPSYPGGQPAAEQFINNHVQYPEPALNYNKEGTVQVQFTVNENGKVSNVHEVGNKLGEGLDDEAVRVVASMPSWNPAMINGRAIRSQVTLPITFRIEE